MKKKRYCVTYSTCTSYDAAVVANNKEEAKNKVIEVIGEPVTIEDVWEIKSEK